MMNLQRLEEVRSNLNNLVSLASIIDPHDDMVAEVQTQLGKIGAIRVTVFDPVPVVVSPSPSLPETRVIQPVRNLVASAVIAIRRKLEWINRFRTSLFPSAPKPVEPPKAKAPEPTRRLPFKPRPPVPIQVRKPEKFEIPTPPTTSRKIPSTNTYNPERYVPYKVLWAKVIIRAAYDYALWKDSKDLRLKKFAQEAERWLFEPSDVELSFENICQSFDFPMERIRQKTRAMTKDDVKKLEFRERHGRLDPTGALTSGNDE